MVKKYHANSFATVILVGLAVEVKYDFREQRNKT
jgi:hypothetical protein